MTFNILKFWRTFLNIKKFCVGNIHCIKYDIYTKKYLKPGIKLKASILSVEFYFHKRYDVSNVKNSTTAN